MSATTHTPGPWQWYWRAEDREANCGVFYEEREGMATSVCRAPRYVTRKQWESNARLIAAAPDLLEACAALVQARDGLMSGLAERTEAATEKARAAIAKATGSA